MLRRVCPMCVVCEIAAVVPSGKPDVFLGQSDAEFGLHRLDQVGARCGLERGLIVEKQSVVLLHARKVLATSASGWHCLRKVRS